ncbi:class B sortase [Collinsella sp. AGMB00827]|uniref:Class B sortase n=1 Tax=Collinsella ureilytica TaxID=2869515 RepID=A0ABS7MK73_9ACTN|nr:class B sortase [Collinsella urealyticum]
MISTILIVVGIALLLVAGGIFIHAQLGYREAQASYKQLEQYAVKDKEGDGLPQVDFDELSKINPDIVGWIYVPNTVINYPIVKTNDNETYLYRLFDRSGNGSGTIFMDMDNAAPGMMDEQTTVYGHHMNDGSMFNYIDQTLKQDAFNTIKTVYYITRDATYTCTPLYTMQVEDTYNDARVPNFGDGKSLEDYLRDGLTKAKAQAPDAESRIGSTKQVFSLITCAGEIIPRTTRAVMVCSVDKKTDRAPASPDQTHEGENAGEAAGGEGSNEG